jgi:hypothetical protein
MGVGQRGPPVCSATGCPQPNQALELTAPNAGVVALRGVVAWGPQLTAGVRALICTSLVKSRIVISYAIL